MENYIDTVFSTVTDQDKIKNEIFFPFKVITHKDEYFIRKSKTVLCYEIHLPFSLGFEEGYRLKIVNKEVLFIYSEQVRHEHMISVVKCYYFFKESYDKVGVVEKDFVINNSIGVINDIVKIIKSRYGNIDLYLLNSANRDYSDMLFTYDNKKSIVTHGEAVINVDSIYTPDKPKSKSMFTNIDEYSYLLEKLEEKTLDRTVDAFYYLCIAKENEIEKNYNFAVVNLQTGIEIFMYDLFSKFIEKGICPKPKNELSKLPYRNLLSEHLKKALESENYKFDLSEPNNDLYNYWEKLYLQRNKIVHEGYVISYNEYNEEAGPACDQLINGLSRVISERYPSLEMKINYER